MGPSTTTSTGTTSRERTTMVPVVTSQAVLHLAQSTTRTLPYATAGVVLVACLAAPKRSLHAQGPTQTATLERLPLRFLRSTVSVWPMVCRNILLDVRTRT